VTKNKYCKKCDIRRLNRSDKGDKIYRDNNNAIIMEEIAFTCAHCGAKWKQKIDYRRKGKQVISWRKVA
jgi:hypothetical protein